MSKMLTFLTIIAEINYEYALRISLRNSYNLNI